MKRRSLFRVSASMALLGSTLGLAACGGGGGGGSMGGPAPAPAPIPPAPAPAPRTFAYVAASTSEEIAIFRVEEGGGLSPAGAVSDAQVRKVVMHPAGRLAYAVDAAANRVSAFSVDQKSGMLTLIAAFDTGDDPRSIGIHPSGRFAYVSNRLGGSVSIYAIRDDGTLEAKAPFAVGDQPFGLAMHASGRFLLVGAGLAITSFGIDDNGDLSVADTLSGTQIPFAVAISPDGKFVYVTNNDGSFGIHGFDPDTGELAAATTVPLTNTEFPLLFHPEGRFAYLAAPNAAAIVVLTVEPDGGLSDLQILQPLPGEPNALAISPSGQALYATNRTEGTVSIYTIESGELTPLGTPITISSPANGITIASFVD